MSGGASAMSSWRTRLGGGLLERGLLERGGLVALVTAVLYSWLAPHHVVDGDNAEFATLSVSGGAAHPPGYPIYVLWLRAMSWLPGATPAHSAAIATSILGALAVLVLHAACRAWGARPLSSTVAVAIFATAPVVLRVVTVAEVFALNMLVVAAVLWLSAERGPCSGGWRAALLGFVAGVGLANHHTCVLVAPVGLLGLVRSARETTRRRALLLALAGLVCGLLPYAYLLVAPETPASWGEVRSMPRLLAMFLRSDYGGPTQLRAIATTVSPWTSIGALVETVGRSWLWAPAVAGVAMLAVRSIRPSVPDTEARAGWIALAASWVLAGPVLVSRFNIPPTTLGLFICQRFHILPCLLLAIPVAIAVDRIPVRYPRALEVIVAIAGVTACAALALPYLSRVHSSAVEHSAKNMLRTLPEGAVVIHGQDEFHVVPAYVQVALHERPDVRIVTWPLMSLPWYREHTAKLLGATTAPGSTRELVTELLRHQVPVFVDPLQREILDEFRAYPYGILMHVLPADAPRPSVLAVFQQNEQVYSQFSIDEPQPGPDDEYSTEVHARYERTWNAIATALARDGHPAEADVARAHAAKLGPRR